MIIIFVHVNATLADRPSEEESEESSSGEVEIEQEVPSDPEDPRELHPGALLHRASRLHNLPLMAEALAHGADIHAASEEEVGKTPLIQAVMGVSQPWRWTKTSQVIPVILSKTPSIANAMQKKILKRAFCVSVRAL